MTDLVATFEQLIKDNQARMGEHQKRMAALQSLILSGTSEELEAFQDSLGFSDATEPSGENEQVSGPEGTA